MKTIKLSEEEIKRIINCLETAARFYGLARVSAIKAGLVKDYAVLASQKSEALFACKALKKAVEQSV